MVKPRQAKFDLTKFYQITEVDEQAHVVRGVATAEKVDRDGEICIYADTKPLYQAWSSESLLATTAAGQDASMGNIRLQHTTEIAGKVTGIDYDDAKCEIRIATEPLNETIWDMVKKGFVTGFSQGGKYLYRNCAKCDTDCGEPGKFDCPACGKRVVVKYACKPAEVSYVDRPCLSTAHFSFIKADGSKEVRKFEPGNLAKAGKTKRVANEDLTSGAFAYVGDPADTSTWKLPYKFSTDTKTKSHIRNALARFGQTEGIPDGDRPKVKARLLAAARAHGIVTNGLNKSDTGGTVIVRKQALVQKGMYDIGVFARLLGDLKYLESGCRSEGAYEDDETDIEVADTVLDGMKTLVGALQAMVTNETNELTAATKAAEGADVMKGINEVLKAARASMSGILRKQATHHESAATNHKALADEHSAMEEAHKGAMDDCGDAMKSFHRGMAAHNKSLASNHNKLAKSHESQMTHCTKAATAYDEDTTKLDEPEVTKTATVVDIDVAKAAKEKADTEAAAVAKAAAATTTAATDDAGSDIQKMISAAVRDAVKSGVSDLNGNPDIKQMVAKAVADQVAAMVGKTVMPTSVTTDGGKLVDRTGKEVVKAATADDNSSGL